MFHGIASPVAADTFLYADGGLARYEDDARARRLKQLEKIAAPLRAAGIRVDVSTDWDFPPH